MAMRHRHIGPFGVFKADRLLCLFAHFVRVDPLASQMALASFEVFDAVFNERGVDLVDAALRNFQVN